VSSSDFSLSGSANRITDLWKISLATQNQQSRSRFDLGDERIIRSSQRTRAVGGLIVRSIGDHVAVGARANAASSTFLNQSRTLRLAPAVEYNFYPYRESMQRILTIEYSAGINDIDYVEETIFRRTAETLFDQRLLSTLRFTQPWGSAELSLEASHYLNDVSKSRAIVSGSLDWNVYRGLSLVATANYQRIRDQLYLPARGASDEEILVRQRQLATGYTYTMTIGFSYWFGSPFAGVVNPRFGGSAGGITLTR
jgi:hypothetical protein